MLNRRQFLQSVAVGTVTAVVPMLAFPAHKLEGDIITFHLHRMTRAEIEREALLKKIAAVMNDGKPWPRNVPIHGAKHYITTVSNSVHYVTPSGVPVEAWFGYHYLLMNSPEDVLIQYENMKTLDKSKFIDAWGFLDRQLDKLMPRKTSRVKIQEQRHHEKVLQG